MKLFVILSAVFVLSAGKPSYEVEDNQNYGYQGPAAPLAHDGTVLDTPEVAHAKAAHLAAHAAAAARVAHRGHQNYDQGAYYGYNEDHRAYDGPLYAAPHAQAYNGPAAPLAHDGRVVDTPEVAQAKAAHLAAHAHAASRASHYVGYEDDGAYRGQITGHGYAVPIQIAYSHASPIGYNGPLAPLGHDGRVIDTPEVAQARAAHLEAYAQAAALAAAHQEYASPEAPTSSSVTGQEASSAEEPTANEESYY